MNIETANRLLQYRKQSGFSQEELAEKIGVSRQAVSKWERAEASPDTDNLILLAGIYGVTLDELLTGEPERVSSGKTDEPQNNSQESVESSHEEDKDSKVSFKHGIHIHDGGDKVDISLKKGIHVHSKDGTKVDIDNSGVSVIDDNGEQKFYTDEDGHIHGVNKCGGEKSKGVYRVFKRFPYPILAVLGFLLFGHYDIVGGYSTCWIWFLTIPLYYTTIDAIEKRNLSHFCYPVFVVMIYCFIGMYYSVWHPMWLLFLTIPIFYFFANLLKPKAQTAEDNQKKENSIVPVVISIVVTVILLLSMCTAIAVMTTETKTYGFKRPLDDLHTDNIIIDSISSDINIFPTSENSYLEYKSVVKGLHNENREDVKIEYSADTTKISECNYSLFFGYKRTTINIYLTEEKYYESLLIDSISGTVKGNDINAQKLTVDSTSGDIKMTHMNAENLGIDVTSGDVEIDGVFKNDVQIDTTSGDVKLTNVVTPKKMKVDSTSGDVILCIPKSTDGFTLEYDKTSGSIKSDFPLVGNINDNEGKAVYGEGKADFNIDITSGDVIIKKAVPQELVNWLFALPN
ncbi:MAG: DUF4097 family beta strand repeat protein [Oscillospiraceae bacterium]|nr:DUF4097 family beta strand repeat protein [Oscillospiraceae bacterium]